VICPKSRRSTARATAGPNPFRVHYVSTNMVFLPLEVHQSVTTVDHITAGQGPNDHSWALVTTGLAVWFEPSIAH